MRRGLVTVALGTVLLTLAAASAGCVRPVERESAQATQEPAAATTPWVPTLWAPPPTGPSAAAPAAANPTAAAPTPSAPASAFASVSKLVTDAIEAHELPGAVVVVGHAGNIAFHQAYGSRKLAGEPGLDGSPAPAEPMTIDTIFDVASLTKPLATATAVMQLYEQGKVQLDDPVQTYLPDFNTEGDWQRAEVTVRMLLTHTSGETGDVNLGDPWGLSGPDKAEGLHRALTTPLVASPGQVFRYSDINFILLGALIEEVTGDPEDVYVQLNIFEPLGMKDTRYLPLAKACGPHEARGAAIAWAPESAADGQAACAAGTWNTDLLSRIAPTARDEENRNDPSMNPDLDYLLRGTVHDTTARRMGGVAGHAGVFSTAQDVSIFARALLDRLAGRPSAFPLQQATLQLMTTPQQPGHTAEQLQTANDAARAAVANAPNSLLAPNYPAIRGQNLRGLGWDIDSFLSQPRGVVFPIGSFGHTGFTGTSIWIDPASDSYVILLTNAIHVRGSPPTSNLAGEIGTAAARALNHSAAAATTPAPAGTPPR